MTLEASFDDQLAMKTKKLHDSVGVEFERDALNDVDEDVSVA